MPQLSPRVQALVQSHLRNLDVYDPNFTPTRINLSANENTYDVPPAARAAIDEALAATHANRYPDPLSNGLRDELAAWHGTDRAHVIVGNGGDELLYNFLLAFGGPGRTRAICPPTFSEYAFFASLTQTDVAEVWRDPETMLADEGALVDAAGKANLVILTSPNNPTGDLAPVALVRRLCEACPGLVMVDEAYGEFAAPGSSCESLLGARDNLVVLHTLSKAFALAGTRCGYVLAAPDVVEALAAVRHEFEPTVATIVSERARVLAALRGLARTRELTVWPSEGNYLLVRVPGASEVRQRLRDEHSILVRDFSYAPGLTDCLRITVGTPEENDAVLAALGELLPAVGPSDSPQALS